MCVAASSILQRPRRAGPSAAGVGAGTQSSASNGDGGFTVTFEAVGCQGLSRRHFRSGRLDAPDAADLPAHARLPEDYRARYDWGRAYGAHCLILALTAR